MNQFIGRYYHALEQKGRISIPKPFRPGLMPQAIITIGLDGCLFLLPDDNWQAIAADALKLPLTNKQGRDWVRLLANQASQVTFDNQGRILIPEHLQIFAHLTKSVCVVGSLNRVELWDQDTYHQYLAGLQQDVESVAQAISALQQEKP